MNRGLSRRRGARFAHLALLALAALSIPSARTDAAEIDPALLAGLKARSIGPAGMSGRVAAVDVAPNDPNVIYVGSGEGLQRPDLSIGDGIYKSTDAGHTWKHLGLRDGQQIPQIAVDPQSDSAAAPERVSVRDRLVPGQEGGQVVIAGSGLAAHDTSLPSPTLRPPCQR